MSLTVYTISGSPSAWRVLLGLAFKKLDYDIHYLNLSDNEHKSEVYLKINPRGTVPALVTDSVTLRDSIAILAWLDRAYPSIPLFGRTPDEAALIWQTSMDSSEYMRNANKGLLLPIFFQGVKEKTDDLIQAADICRSELKRLEASLVGNDFIAGDGPSAADAICFPEARMVKRAIDTHSNLMLDLGFQQDMSDFPSVACWIERVESMDGVGKTMPVHWD